MLIVCAFFLYQSNIDACPFSKLSSNQTQNDVVKNYGPPDESTKWTFPGNGGEDHIMYVDDYAYTFMNNTGDLSIYYSGGKVYNAYFRLDYPLYNPSIFDKSVKFSEETVEKLALHIIKYYTKEHGNYRLKRDNYVWDLDGGETISLEVDTRDNRIPIKLEWHSNR